MEPENLTVNSIIIASCLFGTAMVLLALACGVFTPADDDDDDWWGGAT